MRVTTKRALNSVIRNCYTEKKVSVRGVVGIPIRPKSVTILRSVPCGSSSNSWYCDSYTTRTFKGALT